MPVKLTQVGKGRYRVSTPEPKTPKQIEGRIGIPTPPGIPTPLEIPRKRPTPPGIPRKRPTPGRIRRPIPLIPGRKRKPIPKKEGDIRRYLF